MAEAQAGWGRYRVTVLNVLGVAWVAIHVFIMVATPAAAFFPLLLAAVPFFVGMHGIERGFHRAPAITVAGALLMVGADIFMTVIYPHYPNSYPFEPMIQFIGRLTGSNVQVRSTPAPVPMR
jgi:hypothetical protein